MGNVGNIEKVMVFGILAIILCILGIAIWGHHDGQPPLDEAQAKTPLDVGGLGESADEGTPMPPLKRPVDIGGDDLSAAPRILVPEDDEADLGGPIEPPDVTLTPPSPAAPERGPAGLPRTHTIAPGDTYTSLAERFFGDPRLYVEFEKVNEDVDPRRLRAGMVVNVPQLTGDDLPEAEIEAPRTAPKDPAGGATAGGVKYVIRSGDTLSAISRQFYGTPNKWRRIADANPRAIPNPDRLTAGVEIQIP